MSELVDWWANCMTTPEPRTLQDKYLKEAGYYIMSPAETAKTLTFKILELAEEKQKVAAKDAEIARLKALLFRAYKWLHWGAGEGIACPVNPSEPDDTFLAVGELLGISEMDDSQVESYCDAHAALNSGDEINE